MHGFCCCLRTSFMWHIFKSLKEHFFHVAVFCCVVLRTSFMWEFKASYIFKSLCVLKKQQFYCLEFPQNFTDQINQPFLCGSPAIQVPHYKEVHFFTLLQLTTSMLHIYYESRTFFPSKWKRSADWQTPTSNFGCHRTNPIYSYKMDL